MRLMVWNVIHKLLQGLFSGDYIVHTIRETVGLTEEAVYTMLQNEVFEILAVPAGYLSGNNVLDEIWLKWITIGGGSEKEYAVSM